MANSDPKDKHTQKEIRNFQTSILNWYDTHRRTLPWRYETGDRADPYRVWLSEIMLQQTTVTAVKPYFEKFLTLWPTVLDLAAAPLDSVMHAWAGLGYYSRARNLHKAAQHVAYDYDGIFPSSQADLIALPGVGDYTSAAIAAIAFGEAVPVLDGNIERIYARYCSEGTPIPKAKSRLKEHARPYFKSCHRPGDFAQALMDIGSSVCTPKSPNCLLCPVRDGCLAHQGGEPTRYPVKAKKKARPSKVGDVYWVENEEGLVLLERRPDTGLLAHMNGFPTSQWVKKGSAPVHDDTLPFHSFQDTGLCIDHVFTHFDLTLHIKKATYNTGFCALVSNHLTWARPGDTVFEGLPTLFRKVYMAIQEAV